MVGLHGECEGEGGVEKETAIMFAETPMFLGCIAGIH
jgi:hypothetical protein